MNFHSKGRAIALMMILEAKDASGEVDGREGFALEDREVDLDLIQPTCVSGQVHKQKVEEAPLQPAGGTLAAMDGAAVHDPEDSAGRTVGLRVHDLGNPAIEPADGDLLHHPADQPSLVHIPGGYVRTPPLASVFVLDAHGVARRGEDLMAGVRICGPKE